MSEYQLQIKQTCSLSTLPNPQAVRAVTDKSPGHSHKRRLRAFSLYGVYSYANFRTSYRRIEGASYTVYTLDILNDLIPQNII